MLNLRYQKECLCWTRGTKEKSLSYNTVRYIVYNPASIKYIPFLFFLALALALLPVRQGGQGVDVQSTFMMGTNCVTFSTSL